VGTSQIQQYHNVLHQILISFEIEIWQKFVLDKVAPAALGQGSPRQGY